jgi:DNA-binding MarR family transcriptional regulator
MRMTPPHRMGRTTNGRVGTKERCGHRSLSPEQAQMIREAIANHRAILRLILRLLRAWERETVRVMESLGRHKR